MSIKTEPEKVNAFNCSYSFYLYKIISHFTRKIFVILQIGEKDLSVQISCLDATKKKRKQRRNGLWF